MRIPVPNSPRKWIALLGMVIMLGLLLGKLGKAKPSDILVTINYGPQAPFVRSSFIEYLDTQDDRVAYMRRHYDNAGAKSQETDSIQLNEGRYQVHMKIHCVQAINEITRIVYIKNSASVTFDLSDDICTLNHAR